MLRSLPHGSAAIAGGALLLLLLAAPARAGTIDGQAHFPAGTTLPAEAVFEVMIEDISIADAPARVLAQRRITPPGPPPIPFSIRYRDGDVDPWARYSLRATVRHRGRLLFTTDTITPVLDGSVESAVVRLIPVPRVRTSPPPHR
jgi:putative lipoprotein